MSMVTETELAYAAGFFDGEGHVGIVANKHHVSKKVYHRLQLSVTCTDVRPIIFFHERWGGAIMTPRYFAKDEWRTAHRWQVASHEAEAFLKDIRPYLVVKGEQADAALEFRSTFLGRSNRNGAKLTPDIVEKREGLKQLVSDLNHGRA